MNQPLSAQSGVAHDHVFLGRGHQKNERKTWAVIGLCSVMMLVEIIGGSLFGSLALVADGLHMSTHASAMLIAALAYVYARKHANDRRFVFGTGKLGDLAGFTSAIILAMIALLIGYEAVVRFLAPIAIHFDEAIPIAVVGLAVNLLSAWLLSGADHAELRESCCCPFRVPGSARQSQGVPARVMCLGDVPGVKQDLDCTNHKIGSRFLKLGISGLDD